MKNKNKLWVLVLLGLIVILILVANSFYKGITIFHYHAVNDDHQAESSIRIYPQDFAWQMNYLKAQGYHVVDLEQAVDYLKNGTKLPPKAVAITFDDGYEDNFIHAFPILKKLQYPATIFLVTGEIGGENSWDIEKGMPAKKILTWPQINEMSQANISFQAHTIHHDNITKLSKEQAQQDLKQSKEVLEQHFNKPLDFFAYPYGSLNQDTVDLVRGAGYKAAFTSSPGINIYGKTDLYRIRRMPIKELHSGFWGRLLFVLELKLRPIIPS